VRNICGYPQIADGRLYATVDELKVMREYNMSILGVLTTAPRRGAAMAPTAPGG
jgi:hypothetical protein